MGTQFRHHTGAPAADFGVGKKFDLSNFKCGR